MREMGFKEFGRTRHDKWEDSKKELEVLKSAIDPTYLLKSLGFESPRETSRELRTKCKIHGGDNDTSFRFNKDRKTWVCFSHKCHELYGNDILGLIMCALNVDFVTAVGYLKSLVGDVGDVNSRYAFHKRQKECEEFVRLYGDGAARPWYVSEDQLSNFYRSKRSDYFNRKGFSNETLDFFEVAGGWHDENGEVRDIIPIRNDTGELEAYSLRSLVDKADEDDKYRHTPGFDKDNCLYNLHRAKYYANKLPVVVVEGFKSVWRLYDYGIHNVVAIMGSSLSEGQRYLLISYAVNGVVLLFDNDVAGVKGTSSAYGDLQSMLKVRPVFIQEVDVNGKGLDPADLSRDQAYEYLKTFI